METVTHIFLILSEYRHDRGESELILTDNQWFFTARENVIELLEFNRHPPVV